jgi:hypothetical protein
MNAIPGSFRTAFRGDLEQDFEMKAKTDSAMKLNSFRPIPESRSASLRNERSPSLDSPTSAEGAVNLATLNARSV